MVIVDVQWTENFKNTTLYFLHSVRLLLYVVSGLAAVRISFCRASSIYKRS